MQLFKYRENNEDWWSLFIGHTQCMKIEKGKQERKLVIEIRAKKERGNEKKKEKNSTGRNTISPIINVQINDLSLILTFSTLWSLKYIANRTKLAC